jgi:sec-independent protein translocase protein TatA
MTTLGFLNNLHGWEMLALLVLALLIFGKRLPEVGKSLGRGIVEFRKGLKGIEDEIETESSKPAARPPLAAGGQDARVSRADSVEAGGTGTPTT